MHKLLVFILYKKKSNRRIQKLKLQKNVLYIISKNYERGIFNRKYSK